MKIKYYLKIVKLIINNKKILNKIKIINKKKQILINSKI